VQNCIDSVGGISANVVWMISMYMWMSWRCNVCVLLTVVVSSLRCHTGSVSPLIHPAVFW